MAIPVIMPRQGQSVESCIITRWFKKKGESLKTGDLLFSYETDKAAFDMESPADGTLLEIYFPEGSEAPVLVNVAVIGNIGEDTEPFRPVSASGIIKQDISEEYIQSEKVTALKKESDPLLLSGEPHKIRISPRAKKFAEKKGIDFSKLRGSGPYGRIICEDVNNAIDQAGAHPEESGVPVKEFTDQPLSNVRKLIAKAMMSSLHNSAQLTHHMSADARNILETRRYIKEGQTKGLIKDDITLNDMICWCVVRALLKFPEINSHFLDDHKRIFSGVHLGLAVDTQRGLMVPVIRNAHEMNISRLSHDLRAAADACRKGNIDPELIKSTSASFTVSNLGNYGVEMFTPVINLPQSAILGVCTIINRPADLGNNILGFVPYLGLSLTYDHRSVDGGPATLFLKEIKEQIEKFKYTDIKTIGV